MENTIDKKTSRASQTREKTAHKKVWTPPSPLDSPLLHQVLNIDGLELSQWDFKIRKMYLPR